MSIPCTPRPCRDCPFRKDTTEGWLGQERMTEILGQDSFVCHKSLRSHRLQCAGHMLIKGEANGFVRIARRLGVELKQSGRELVFDTEANCIRHHAQKTLESA